MMETEISQGWDRQGERGQEDKDAETETEIKRVYFSLYLQSDRMSRGPVKYYHTGSLHQERGFTEALPHMQIPPPSQCK